MFRFTHEHPETRTTGKEFLAMELDAESLPEVLEAFERFLRGVGFAFDGEIGVIPPEIPIPTYDCDLETKEHEPEDLHND